MPVERVRAVVVRLHEAFPKIKGGQAWDHRGSMNRNWQLLFDRLDKDKSGRLDYDEFEQAVRSELRVTDTTDQELRALWAYVDHDRSGEVTISEFQHCLLYTSPSPRD